MDTTLLRHVILFLLGLSTAALPTEQHHQQVNDDDVLNILRCRAMCLDEFSNDVRTEGHCRKENDCRMCWDTCSLLHTSFRTWGPMCAVPDICFPGCQRACATVTSRTNITTEKDVDSPVSLHSQYDPQTDKVILEWSHIKELETKGCVLYSILLREKGSGCQEWDEITQTTSHVIQAKRGLFSRDTDIRLVAANATGLVTDIVTPYVDSFVAETDDSFIDFEEEISKIIHGDENWRPHLLSIRQTHKSLGVQATVTWPLLRSPGSAKYEVSWNVIDDTIEITGHLQTSSNLAVLTLWPNALYSVQINAYVANEELVSKSVPLVIDTRIDESSTRVTSISAKCHESSELLLVACLGISVVIISLGLLGFLYKRQWTRPSKESLVENQFSSKDSIPEMSNGQCSVLKGTTSQKVEPKHKPKCSFHGSLFSSVKLPQTRIDLRNIL